MKPKRTKYKAKEYFYTPNNITTKLLTQFQADFKIGKNVSREKGSRKPVTIRNTMDRVRLIAYHAEKLFKLQDITQLTENQLLTIIHKMENGEIKRIDGKPYKTVTNHVIGFSVFWRWYIKKMRREHDKIVPNIVEDLSTGKHNPGFEWISREELEKLVKQCKIDYKTIFWFMFESGIRPQEFSKLKVGDIQINKDVVWLHIRDEIAKKGSFGRRIKLLFCGKLMQEWIKGKLKNEALFDHKNTAISKYLKRLTKKLFKKGLTMYDLRHSSVIYYISVIHKDTQLKYRFGWKDSRRIEYYSRYIGVEDTLQEDDIIDPEEKTKLASEVESLRLALERQNERVLELQESMSDKDAFMRLLLDKGVIEKMKKEFLHGKQKM